MELEKVKEFVKNSNTKKEVIEGLGYSYNFRTREKLKDIIEKNNIDTSHFKSSGELQKKYFLIKKECPKCGKEFETQNGGKNSKEFCSRSCSNSRVITKETKEKISIKIKDGYKDRIITEKMILAWKNKGLLSKKIAISKIIQEDFQNLSFERKRKRVIHEQNYCCNKCKNEKWMGEQISLEIEHKDGDNKNNIRENLEALCPNCHSLTKTWRGRNKKNQRKKISDEQLLNALISCKFVMRQALEKVGLSAKGGNYKRCHKIIRDYNGL